MKSQAQQVIPLYNNDIQDVKMTPPTYKEKISAEGKISKVSAPTLTMYPAEKPNGTSVIICPGGGYALLSIEKEGHKVAREFQKIGVTAFVLKYRLPSDSIMTDKSLGPLQDALKAIYLVRKNANNWHINQNRIGIMGFSAGGHLASLASTHFADLKIFNPENINLRPDFSILIYPVITFGKYTHKGSVKNLLGEEPTDAQLNYFSTDLQVKTTTPKTFIVHANDDKTVAVQNSINYNLALLKNKVQAELHIYQAGGHGFGLNNPTTTDKWFERLENWMKANQLIE